MRLAVVLLAACGRVGFDPTSTVVDDAPIDATPRCSVVDDRFDAATLDPNYATFVSGGAPAPTPVGGELVLDVTAVNSACAISTKSFDLRDIEATVTVRDFAFATGTQTYLEMANLTRDFAMMAIDPNLVRARIQDGMAIDDVPFAVGVQPVVRFRMTTHQVAGGTELVWSYALDETAAFIELRRQTFPESFASGSVGVEYQSYGGATADPPPLTVDDFTVDVPCP